MLSSRAWTVIVHGLATHLASGRRAFGPPAPEPIELRIGQISGREAGDAAGPLALRASMVAPSW